MVDMQYRNRINQLLSIYGEKLSPLQKEDLISYYSDDLSLSEIALNRNVSRNAIHLSIKNGEKELDELESKLHILAIFTKINKELDTIYEDKSKEEILEIVRKIKEELTHGI